MSRRETHHPTNPRLRLGAENRRGWLFILTSLTESDGKSSAGKSLSKMYVPEYGRFLIPPTLSLPGHK